MAPQTAEASHGAYTPALSHNHPVEKERESRSK
jgi:hypothetical protein